MVWDFFPLLLIFTLFKLPHFCNEIFIDGEKNKSQLFLRGIYLLREKSQIIIIIIINLKRNEIFVWRSLLVN